MSHSTEHITSQIRARALTGFPELVSELGGNPSSLLRRYHINPQHLADGDTMIDFRQLVRVLEAAAVQLDCLDFGLLMAQRQGLDVLGPLALLVRNSLTLNEALMAVARYLPYHSPQLRLELVPDRNTGCHCLSYDILLPECPQRRQTVELSVSVVMETLALLLQGRQMIGHVRFRHAAAMPLSRYRRYFSCPVSFEQESNAVVFSSGSLQMPVATSNPDIRRVADVFVADIVDRNLSDLRSQVDALIRRQLSNPKCSIGVIAGQLALHPRTLQRRLEALGLRFDVLIDSLRKERAAEYLLQPRMRLITVAQLLGYTEQTSLNRSCQRWFGKSPQQVRKEL